MLYYPKVEFYFPLVLSERSEQEKKFILEGFAASNDFDLQNDIISDVALRKAVKDFKERGKVCLNHTKEIIGKVLECHFRGGKIWIKIEISKPSIIKRIKSGELNSLSVKGQVDYEKVELYPGLSLKVIRDLFWEEVSLVPQGASPEAKAIRWYVTNAIKMAKNNMLIKNSKEELKELEETEDGDPEDVENEETEDEEEDKEEEVKNAEEEEKEEEEEEEESDEEESEEEEEKELTEGVYVEKSAYTQCMKKELKKGTPFKEAAKICSGKVKKSGKQWEIEKSAYTDCMKEELKKGTPFKEAAKVCKEKTKEEKTEETEKQLKDKKKYPYAYPYKYPYGYPYGYPYPYRYPKGMRKAADLDAIIEALTKVIETTKDKESVSALKKIKSALSAIQAKYPSAYPYPKKKNLSEETDKIVYQSVNLGEIELEEGKFKKELLREGTWFHGASKDGVLEVTKEMLKKIVENFKSKVLDHVFVPLGHPKDDNPMSNVGEVVNLELSKDGEKLLAEIIVKDESVAEKIKKGLVKGISASIVESYMKKDTGDNVGPTLFHAALVNEPYIKGMAEFVPLSEEFEGSLVIPILNMEPPLTMSELSSKIEKIEKQLSEKEETSEETSEKASEEEESEEEESKSPKVSEEKAEEKGEEEETKTEKSETEETEEETEEPEDKEGVDLSDGEKIFDTLLRQGRVTPTEKELLLPLFESKDSIELSDGKKVNIRKTVEKFLKSRKPVFSLKEDGVIEGKKEKQEEIPDEVKVEMDKMGLSEDIQGEAYQEFKKSKEGKKEEETTPF